MQASSYVQVQLCCRLKVKVFCPTLENIFKNNKKMDFREYVHLKTNRNLFLKSLNSEQGTNINFGLPHKIFEFKKDS